MGWFPGSGRRKLAAGAALDAMTCASGLAAPAATQAQVTPIRHVVVINLENHSFDNLLGYWPGHTDTTAATSSGILGYTEHIFGLSPLGANSAPRTRSRPPSTTPRRRSARCTWHSGRFRHPPSGSG